MAERPEDLNLPSSVVTKIIKDALPPNVKVSKEANAAVAKAASVFVLYATSCANNVASKNKRKMLHGSDVIAAMEEMEFAKFVRPLESSLDNWKAGQARKKEETAKRKKMAANSSKTGGGKEGEEDDDVVVLEDSKETASNKEQA